LNTATILPHVTASLNLASAVLLLLAFYLVKTGRKEAHRRAMLSAILVSAVFLAFYLVYHFTAPIFVFAGPAGMKPLYYTLLISHVLLAALVTPMIFLTLLPALKGAFERHKKLARLTFPVWLYVSVSGFVVYLMLYHLFPPAA
jgi:putative membrane protein